MKYPNIIYREPIHGNDRNDYLGDCIAVLCPSTYCEPFCCVAVEAQLCGTPVICSDFGGMTETVENFKTGVRCHTLGDYCYGIQLALEGKFDRKYIRERAVNLYDMYKLAYNYDYIFRSILDIYKPEKNGWYSNDTHLSIVYKKEEYIEIKRRIYLLIVYFGKFPNYFQLYLDSLKMNEDILTVILFTDIDTFEYILPNNLIIKKTSFDEVRIRLSIFILENYDKEIDYNTLLDKPYKLVDIKIIYSLIFNDIVNEYNISTDDYIGWGDIDVIYGKLSNFINFNENYEIIGGYHGHFTAIKNTLSFKNLYKNVENYLNIILDNSKVYIADEIAYREPLLEYLKINNYKMYYINASFCDIVPPCFYYLFRPDHDKREKNFFNNSNPNKNISYLYFNKKEETLSILYDNENKLYETPYCHLQKRSMELNFTEYDDGYYINEHSFTIDNIKIPKKYTCLGIFHYL